MQIFFNLSSYLPDLPDGDLRLKYSELKGDTPKEGAYHPVFGARQVWDKLFAYLVDRITKQPSSLCLVVEVT